MPNRPLTNLELKKYARKLQIKHFRGVFMIDDLPSGVPFLNEKAIVNLDQSENSGTHWIAYNKIGHDVYYFDSYGNLRPPSDLVKYLNRKERCTIFYNHDRYQYKTYNCGHLCLKFLYVQ